MGGHEDLFVITQMSVIFNKAFNFFEAVKYHKKIKEAMHNSVYFGVPKQPPTYEDAEASFSKVKKLYRELPLDLKWLSDKIC
jgi:hypothetical protein